MQNSTQTTTTTQRTSNRISREQQRNAKAQAAYESIRDLGAVAGAAHLEQFSVASQSQAETRYTVTHDLASDRFHCDCTHGQYGGRGECCHIQAARRFVDERRAREQAAWERDQRAGGYGYNDSYNLSYGTQATSDY